jgi:glutamate 5-kinase
MRNVIMYAFRLTIGKMIEMSFLDNYKRVVIKIGSSTLTHAETGSLNFSKMSVWCARYVITETAVWMCAS